LSIGVIRGLRRLLSDAERRQLWRVLLLALLTGVIQTLAVFSVMPFFAVVTDPTAALQTSLARGVAGPLGVDSERELLTLSASVVLLLVLSANVLGALSLRRVQLTAWNISHYLTRRLLAVYLHRPYDWFLGQHSAELGQKLLNEVGMVAQGALVPLMTGTVRGVEGILVVLLLISVDWRITLVAGGVMGGAYLVTYWSVRRIQERLGATRARTVRNRYHVTIEALSGVKEIKSLGAEEEFIRRLDKTGPAFVRARARSAVLAELPRYMLEVLSLGTVLVVTLGLALSGGGLEDQLPVLALFGFAGFKLVPSFHQVFSAASKVSFAAPAIAALEEDLEMSRADPVPHSSPGPRLPLLRVLALDRVTVRYPNAEVPALHELSFSIKAGERVGVVGPTGAGKTTLVDVLLGLILTTEGDIRIDDVPLDMREAGWRWRLGVGYVPQRIYLSGDSVANNIAFGVAESEVDLGRVRRAARGAELDEFVQSLPEGYDTWVGERGVRLSGGQAQRVGIARALYRDPSLMLLDEATSALDSGTEEAVMRSIYGLGRDRTVLIVAHRLQTVQGCDRILLLDRGKLVDHGSFEELSARSELFRVLARGVAV
jgi:ABC-type multidrug transport system fused ATPase/permease subunit